MKRRVTFSLDSELVRALDREARERGISRGEAMEQILAAWLRLPARVRHRVFRLWGEGREQEALDYLEARHDRAR